jgi:YVTN family beta-propeller protein
MMKGWRLLLLALIVGAAVAWALGRGRKAGGELGTHRVKAKALLAAETRPAGATLLIANKGEDTLSFVDTTTRQVLGTTTTGRGPHEVTVTPDGKKAFVANYEGPGDTISAVDVTARKELRRIPLGEHRGPHGIQASRDGRHVYATCERSRTVIEMDVATEKIQRAFVTDQNVTHMLVLTPDGKKLYTANIGSGSSTAIDLVAGKVVAQISTGAGCEGIDVTPDGKQVWTTNRAADTLSVIDTATDKVVATLPCRGFPIRVKITPDGKAALVSCAQANELAVFDVATRKEDRRLSVGAVPVGILIEPNGARAYVANTAADTVAVFDMKMLAVVDRIAAGREPDGLALVVR